MTDASPIKIPFQARKTPLDRLDRQPLGSAYAILGSPLPQPEGALGYVAELLPGGYARLLACLREDGFAFPAAQAITAWPKDRDAALALACEPSGSTGSIYRKDETGPDAALAPIGTYLRIAGRYRESTASKTDRGLPLAEFLAALYLQRCVFGHRGDDEPEPDTTHGTPDANPIALLQPLEKPVEIFEGFPTLPLPDAIAVALHRIDAKEEPCGIERFARRILGQIDLDHLRRVFTGSDMSLARIERSGVFYINFTRDDLSEEEISFIFSVEAALNRVARVLDAVGSSTAPLAISPTEEACATIDTKLLRAVADNASRVLSEAGWRNPWNKPGTVACEPGGAWDVRTRMVQLCEGMNLAVRFEYLAGYDERTNTASLKFIPPQGACMPSASYDGGWIEHDDDRREDMAAEFGARMALVLAAVAFSSGTGVSNAKVLSQPFAGRAGREWAFERIAFMADIMPQVPRLASTPLTEPAALELADTYATRCDIASEDLPIAMPLLPRNDHRALPPALQRLLLADTADELEVMEAADEPTLKRVADLRELGENDPEAAAAGLVEVIEEMQAGCVAAELLSETPVSSQYCEGYMARMLLGFEAENRDLRINRVPDALFNAQFGLTNLYAQAGMFEQALPEARKLLDMATTSHTAHFAVINVLAHLQDWDEIVEVAKHGLDRSYAREDVAYYLYRLAFAYWNLGRHACALACYRMVPAGEGVSDSARQEMRDLMGEMGAVREPSFADAQIALRMEGVPVPPTPRISNFIADAAVQLTDAGFRFLAERCVYEMWRIMGRDELSALRRSLAE